MTKNKLLFLLIAGLLLANIIMASFLLFRKGPPPHRPEPREIIIERLHFDEKQIAEYDKLITQYKRQISVKEKTLMDLKNEFYSHLKDTVEDFSITDSLANESGKIQSGMERINYIHFEAIKKLCRPEQLDDFNELINELGRLFSPPPREKRPR